jgi:uncharacterized protein (TIGR02270 family)
MLVSSIVPFVVQQHAEELATLWSTRTGLCASGHIRLRDLARFDERIAAHEDGCVVGGEEALRLLCAELAGLSAGRIFATVLVGLALKDRGTLARCLALAEANPEARRGMAAAMGWVESARLRGIVKDLLTAPSAGQRRLGLAACRLQGVDPGRALPAALTDPDDDLRAEAARTAGVLGRTDLHLPSFVNVDVDNEHAARLWPSWAAVLLGARGRALDTLTNAAVSGDYHEREAFCLACQAMSTAAGHEMLRQIAADPSRLPTVLEGSGIVGDPAYVPWLIRQMASVKFARGAGAAFTMITGRDLLENGLEGAQPEEFEPGPNDDPNDANTDMDEDEGLPWPDPTKINAWWAVNGSRFQQGVRYFMGQPVTREHCIHVLKTGFQRQRILAAQYLCLLDPGTPLFNTSAPAWRQQRLLAAM